MKRQPSPHDPADEAMCWRARERYAADRKRMGNVPRRRRKHAAMPNLIIIGGLKCGTTSIHHYLGLHPDVHMSKPKELNFLVRELNWDLGLPWYEGLVGQSNKERRRGLAAAGRPLLRRMAACIDKSGQEDEATVHGPRPDQPDPQPLAPRDGRRLRDPRRSRTC